MSYRFFYQVQLMDSLEKTGLLIEEQQQNQHKIFT